MGCGALPCISVANARLIDGIRIPGSKFFWLDPTSKLFDAYLIYKVIHLVREDIKLGVALQYRVTHLLANLDWIDFGPAWADEKL